MSNEVKSASELKKEDWMNSKWRPMMGWMYMLVCTMDMVVFPILWSLLQTTVGTGLTQWNPLTLQGAGLFHIAMGAVLGIAAFGRTQEKLGGANNGGIQTPTIAPNASFGTPTSFNPPTSSNFDSRFNGTSAQDFQQPMSVTVGFGGKMAPPVAPQPFI
jgi:hypothetical protein